MEFNETFVSCMLGVLKSRRNPFTYTIHTYIDERQMGLYAFWLQTFCLYVGMSKDIRQRIYAHRMNEHNKKLDRYLSAFAQDIEVAYVNLCINSYQELKELEKTAIKRLRPATNIVNTRS